MCNECKFHFCCYCLVLKSCPTFCYPQVLQHSRLPCSSLSLRVCSNSYPFGSVSQSVRWMLSNHLILCHPLLLLPSTFPSNRIFPNELALCNRLPKYRSFNFSISPSNEYSGLISIGIDWFNPVVQGTLKSILQHHSSKASILQHSDILMANSHSHPYITTVKTIALTRQTFINKVMSLFSNMLSRLVIVFLPRSKHLLISELQSPFAVILEPKKIKSVTVSTFAHLSAMK